MKIQVSYIYVIFVFFLVTLSSCSLMRSSASASSRLSSSPPMVLIPEGPFIRGSNKIDKFQQAKELGSKKPWYKDEAPQHEISLPRFYIDQFEVTNAEYKLFIDADHWRAPSYFIKHMIPSGQENFPVSNINWYEADRYCHWKGKRPPTEAEWEKAARGTDGREFPWGDNFETIKKAANDKQSGDIVPVGSFEEGKSPYGVMDMAGNVWEWTSDWYQAYPNATFQTPLFGEKQKVFRGGGGGRVGHYILPLFYRTSYRSSVPPEIAFADLGFRCAVSP